MNRRNAFTLVELFVVIFIVGVLIALLLPAVSRPDPMRSAIYRGDVEQCKQILNKRKFNQASHQRYLLLAIQANKLDVCKYFIEELKTPFNNSEALCLTARQNDLSIFYYLIQKCKDFDLNVRDKVIDNTLLHIAAEENNTELSLFLLEKNVDLNAVNKHQITPLGIAARSGHEEVFFQLVDAGATIDLSATDFDGRSLIHLAAGSGNGRITKFLLDRGADPNCKTSYGGMPIHFAAKAVTADACRVLVEAGAEVNTVGPTSSRSSFPAQTPIELAVYAPQTDCFKLLVEAGAKYDAKKSSEDWSLLCFAVSRSDIELCKKFAVEGADLNFKIKRNSTTLLHLAAASNNEVELCQWLIDQGANLEARDYEGKTPLFVAVRANRLEACKCLVENGADIKTVDNKKDTIFSFLKERVWHDPKYEEIYDYLRTQ